MISINNKAPVKCSKSITINAISEKVWSVLTNINHWASWQTEIANAQLEGELKPHATFVWKSGGAKIKSTLHSLEPNKQFGWTGKTFGMLAIHNWTITERNGQTTVAVEESMEGLIAILFKKSFNRNLENGMQKWLELLKMECER